MSDAKDIDRLRSSLEKLIGGAGGRALTRLASLKRPSVGTDPATTEQKNKALLNKLKGEVLRLGLAAVMTAGLRQVAMGTSSPKL